MGAAWKQSRLNKKNPLAQEDNLFGKALSPHFTDSECHFFQFLWFEFVAK